MSLRGAPGGADPAAAPGLVTGARLVVTAGRAGEDEALAVLLAVDQALAAERAAATPPPRPGWRRAARQEGVGAAPVVTPR